MAVMHAIEIADCEYRGGRRPLRDAAKNLHEIKE
jgi:hypothetical protein